MNEDYERYFVKLDIWLLFRWVNKGLTMVNLYNLKFVAEVDIIILSDTVSLAKQ